MLAAILGLRHAAEAQDVAQGPEGARGPVALHWVRLAGSEACIAGDALARVVETKLRRSVFPAPRDASILIEGHVSKTADGFSAELHMTDAKHEQLGSRSLSSSDASCRELSETLGVVLAVMIDPDAAKRSPSALPAPPEPKAKDAAQKAPGGDNRMLAFARVTVGITQNALLGFGAAYERALGVAGGLRFELASFLENDTRVAIPMGEAAHVLVQVAYAGVAYCPLWLTFSRARLLGCAGLELGGVRGHGDNFPPPPPSDTRERHDTAGLWASGSANLRLSIVLIGSLEAHLAGGLLGSFGTRFKAEVADREYVVVLPRHAVPLGGTFDLGLGARF